MPRPRGFEPFSMLWPLMIRKELAHVPGGAYVTMAIFETEAARDAFKASLANNTGLPGSPLWWGDVPPPFEWYNSKGFICGMWNSFL